MPKLLIFDAFTLLIREKTVANYALLRCKTFSLKIWVCKIFDKFHVCLGHCSLLPKSDLNAVYLLPNAAPGFLHEIVFFATAQFRGKSPF